MNKMGKRADIPRLKIFSLAEKNKLIEQLNKQFGIKDIPGIFIMRGAERIFLYQGDLNPREIREYEETLPVERVGAYFAKEQNGEIRLSIEGVYMIKDQITRGVYELSEEEMKTWMHGSEINVNSGYKQFVVMKYKNFFLGCGKASEEKITNFMPKSRRLKFKN